MIIDPVDALGINAANALLKWLEEPPPQSIFILISHHSEKLLPTIRSRCRDAFFAIPKPEIFMQIMAEAGASREESDFLNNVTVGSPGLALAWMRTGWQNHLLSLGELLAAKAEAQPYLLTGMVEMAVKDTLFSLSHWQALLETLLVGITQSYRGSENPALPLAFRHAIQQVTSRFPQSRWLDIWDQQRATYRDMEVLYLDKRNTLMQLLGQMVATR